MNPKAVRSLIALNKVAAGTHRLEIDLDGSYRAVLLSKRDEGKLVTEAAIIRSSMNIEPAIKGESARRYNAMASDLRKIEADLRKHYGY